MSLIDFNGHADDHQIFRHPDQQLYCIIRCGSTVSVYRLPSFRLIDFTDASIKCRVKIHQYVHRYSASRGVFRRTFVLREEDDPVNLLHTGSRSYYSAGTDCYELDIYTKKMTELKGDPEYGGKLIEVYHGEDMVPVQVRLQQVGDTVKVYYIRDGCKYFKHQFVATVDCAAAFENTYVIWGTADAQFIRWYVYLTASKTTKLVHQLHISVPVKLIAPYIDEHGTAHLLMPGCYMTWSL